MYENPGRGHGTAPLPTLMAKGAGAVFLAKSKLRKDTISENLIFFMPQ